MRPLALAARSPRVRGCRCVRPAYIDSVVVRLPSGDDEWRPASPTRVRWMRLHRTEQSDRVSTFCHRVHRERRRNAYGARRSASPTTGRPLPWASGQARPSSREPGRRRISRACVSSSRSRPGPTAVDLFCGAGGLSRGLERAGFDVLVGADSDHWAVRTHDANVRDSAGPATSPTRQNSSMTLGCGGLSRSIWSLVGFRASPSAGRGARGSGTWSTRARPDHDERADLWSSSSGWSRGSAGRRWWWRMSQTFRVERRRRPDQTLRVARERSATASRRGSWMASDTACHSTGSA